MKFGDGPLTTADSAGAAMSLLLFHLFEDGFFLYFDKVASLFLAKAEPELLDALAFFG
jgi:hypothetical protein